MYNTAIIGCGRIFATHADAIQKSDYAKIKMLVDVDEERAASAARKYRCEYSTNYMDALKSDDIDVVHICTPHYLHAAMAIDAMENGKNVLTEKPMAICCEDAQKMIMTSEMTGKELGVCFQNRYNATSIWVKEFLDSGKAGKIISGRSLFSWFRDSDYYASEKWRGTWSMEGGGLLINQAIHTLDLIQWYVGEVDCLKASIDTRFLQGYIEVEDTADVTLQFKNGSRFSFFATNGYTLDAPPLIELHCEKAIVRLEDDIKIDYPDGRIEHIKNPVKAMGDKAYWGMSHETLIKDYYMSLQRNVGFAVNGSQGITALKLVNAIYQSSRTGKFVEIKA